MRSGLTVARKLSVLIAIPLVFQVGLLWLIVTTQQESRAAQRMTLRAQAVTSRAYALLNLLVKADSNFRAGLLTGNQAFLQANATIVQEVDETVRALHEMVEEEGLQAALVQRVDTKLKEKFALIDAMTVAARQAPPDRAAITTHVTSDQRVSRAIRKDMVAFVRHALAATAARHEALERSTSALNRIFIAGMATTILLTVTIFLLFMRDIQARLFVLASNTQRVVKGEPLAPPLGGSDEFTRLDHAFHDMADALAQSARKERAAREAAEAASRTKSQFLASMSHELRTPLNAILGFSEVLGDQTFGPLTERQRQYVDDIRESGQHLLSLINDLLDSAKIEAGKMTLQLGEVDLEALAAQSLTVIEGHAAKRAISVSVDIDPRVGLVPADARLVKQVLLNLLSNAVKFTPEGGRIGLEARRNEPDVVVSVWDTGIGIEAQDRQRLFQEFTQIDSAYARQYAGTGLGLSLAKRFVELHGGRMWVESAGKGQGSRFSFTLPLTPAGSTT